MRAGMERPSGSCERSNAGSAGNDSQAVREGIKGIRPLITVLLDTGCIVALPGNSGGVGKLLRRYADVPMDFADTCLVDMSLDYRA